MAGELEKLLVRLDADTAALRSALSGATRATDDWERRTNRSVKNSRRIYDDFSQGVTSALGKMGAAFGAAATLNFAATLITDAAALQNLAQSAGLTTDQLQGLQYASRAAGTDTKQFEQAISQFASKMGEFRAKSGELYTFLRDQLPVGRELLASTRSQSEALEAAARIVDNLATAEDKATFVKKAFGESAVALIPVFEKLANEGMDGVIIKAREMGQVIDKEAIENSKRLKIEIDMLTASIGTALTNALGTAAGHINRFAKAFFNAQAEIRSGSLGGSNLDEIKSIEKELDGLTGKLQKLSAVAQDMDGVSGPWARRAATEAAILEQRIFDLTNRLDALKSGGGKVAADTLHEVANAARDASGWVTTLSQSGWVTTSSEDNWRIKAKPNTSGTDAIREQHIARLEAEGKFTQAIEVQYAAQVEKFQRMLDQELITEAQFLQAREDANVALAQKIQNAYNESTKYAKAALDEIKNAISGPVMNAFDQWIMTGKLKAQDMFKSILAGIAKIIAQALILKPIMDSIFSLGNPIGSIIGSFLGGFRAQGGPVAAQRPYIVGEKGPELFVPNASGGIIPNSGLRGASPNQSVSYVYTIDARGADIGVADRIAETMRRMMASQPSAPAAVAAYNRRFPTRG